MTISSINRKAGPYTGTGAVATYPFNFKVFDPSDLVVTGTDNNGVDFQFAFNTDYTVALNSDQNTAPGGTVTLTENLTAGYLLTLTSAVPALQNLALTNNGGFFPKVINDALDRVTILIQQALGLTSRSLLLPVNETSLALPPAIQRANMYLKFDASGNAIVGTGAGPKGDPGGNVMSIGLFTSIGTLFIPAGTDTIHTSGFSTKGIGAAFYASVAAGPATLYRQQSADGRWWEIREQFMTPQMMGGIADCTPTTVLTCTDNSPAIQGAINAVADIGGTVFIPSQPFGYGVASTITIPQGVSVWGGGLGDPDEYTTQHGTVLIAKTANMVVIHMTGQAEIRDFSIQCGDRARFGVWFDYAAARPSATNILCVRATLHAYLLDQTQNGTFENVAFKFGTGGILLMNGARNNTFLMCSGEVNSGFYTGTYATARLITLRLDTADPWGIGTTSNITGGGNDLNVFFGGIFERAHLGVVVENPHALNDFGLGAGTTVFERVEKTADLIYDTTAAAPFYGSFIEDNPTWFNAGVGQPMTTGTVGRIVFGGSLNLNGGDGVVMKGITLASNLANFLYTRQNELSSGLPFLSTTQLYAFPCFAQPNTVNVTYDAATGDIIVDSTPSALAYAGIVIELGGAFRAPGSVPLVRPKFVYEILFTISGLGAGETMPLYMQVAAPTFRTRLSLPDSNGNVTAGAGAYGNGTYKVRFRGDGTETAAFQFGKPSAGSIWRLSNFEMTVH